MFDRGSRVIQCEREAECVHKLGTHAACCECQCCPAGQASGSANVVEITPAMMKTMSAAVELSITDMSAMSTD